MAAKQSPVDELIVTASSLLHALRGFASDAATEASGGANRIDAARAAFDAKLAELARVVAQLDGGGGAGGGGGDDGNGGEEDDDGPASAEDLATLQGLRAEVAAKNVLLKGLIDRLRGIQATIDESLEDDDAGSNVFVGANDR